MHKILDEAIGPSPVSTVDVDAVVAAGRRRTRLRRLALISPAVPAVAAVALALTVVGGPPATPSTQVGTQPSSGPSAAPGEAPVYAGETPEQTRQRLASALAYGLATAVPGITPSDGLTGHPGVLINVSDDQNRFDSDMVLATATGQNELFFVSWRDGEQPEYQSPTALPADGPVPVQWFDSCSQVPTNDWFSPEGHRMVLECEESVGAQGQTIVVTSLTCVECPGQPTTRRDAYVTWTNARVIVAIANELKRGETTGTTSTAELLLTKEQLVAIASDPKLTVAA